MFCVTITKCECGAADLKHASLGSRLQLSSMQISGLRRALVTNKAGLNLSYGYISERFIPGKLEQIPGKYEITLKSGERGGGRKCF